MQLKPLGDGVRTMKTALTLEGVPKGVSAAIKEPVVSAADWSTPRDTSFDVEVAEDAPPATSRITLKAALGAIERKVSFDLTVEAKPE